MQIVFWFSKRNWFSFFSIEWSPSYSRSPSNPAILPAACYFKISGFLSIELTTTERTNTLEIGVCAQSQSLRVAWLTGLWFNLSARIDLVKHFHIFTFQFLFFVNFVAFHFFKLNNFALSKIKSLKCLRNLINYLPREIFILCMETSERKTKWNYVNSQNLFNFLPNRGGKKVLINFIISPDGLLCGVLRMDNCHQKWHVPFNFLWFKWLQMEEADGDEGNWLKWVWAVVAGEMGGVLSFVGKRLACCLQR